ncbi:hypothetical protein MPTK1_1g09070 [Marchantia polymorpha subsp. ruderalis]|uniref:Inorganic phosphate transporter n=2 Tax=Marchantia polymorpha TaxID=3197 RepID=A0A176VNY5_MARPO|nr:hypothetical protein AXG93_2318s1140 [Marchantia polymorpha subsp. ruderalis]PTQ41176.1 hypothetical protein MARPO_0036s0147 [Marchantia polymorpha]BBM97875.1 hypothetical protein Mp_1g09070 [Marchantia polymorpha subsp. ruderalis]|eukprot:PTQ41176.1 hypothetical protein MARPO_0036s0147 [Marchantia polymorpha]
MLQGLPWKVLVGPGLLLGLKFAKVDYQTPENLLIVRILYGVSQVFILGLCAFIAYGIRSRGDDKKSLKIKTPPATGGSGEQPTETKMTFKDYDMGELTKLFKNFALGAAVTIGIHVYMQVVPALLLQIVTQPITFIEHPLFSIYVLNKDPAKDSKLKRPFPDNSPAARMEAMKQEALKQKELQEQRDRPSNETLTDGGSTSSTAALDTATGGNAQTSVSTAERRPTRPNTAEEE